ncbi:MAG TPA: hypothetical protein VN461_11950 [Vicinamibacteria bacterium]|nr:hypothetical protein [Vicinamibacteria bacterium]
MAGRIRVLNRIVVFVPCLLLLGQDLGRRIDGAHTFRQAHVAANIEKYLAQGLSLRPATYNLDIPYSLFDFPLYQLAVAALCGLLGSPVLVTARVVNISLFAVCCFLLERLLARCRVHPRQALFCLGLFLAAPLNLFYFSNPMVDGLAVLLSFLSLLAFVGWEETATGGVGLWVLMVVAGVLSTLVKNPVFLPVCLAMASQVVVRRGWRSLLRPGLISFGAAIVAAILIFKLYSNRVNGVASFWARGEAEANFGLLREGLQLENWQGIIHSLGFLTLNPWTGALALFGALAYLRRGSPRYRGLFLGLLLGMVVTVLVFFSRNRPHSYYQLPFAFTLCFFAGYGLHRMAVQIRAAWPRPGRAAVGLAIVGAAAVTWAYSRVGYGELTAPTIDEIAARGEAIREWTDPADFVIYLVDSEPEDWNPSYLYFAKRDGYNVPRSDFSATTLMSVYRSYERRYRRVFVACPARPRILSLRLEGWGLPLAAAGASGRLYRMQDPPPPGAP